MWDTLAGASEALKEMRNGSFTQCDARATGTFGFGRGLSRGALNLRKVPPLGRCRHPMTLVSRCLRHILYYCVN